MSRHLAHNRRLTRASKCGRSLQSGSLSRLCYFLEFTQIVQQKNAFSCDSSAASSLPTLQPLQSENQIYPEIICLFCPLPIS